MTKIISGVSNHNPMQQKVIDWIEANGYEKKGDTSLILMGNEGNEYWWNKEKRLIAFVIKVINSSGVAEDDQTRLTLYDVITNADEKRDFFCDEQISVIDEIIEQMYSDLFDKEEDE